MKSAPNEKSGPLPDRSFVLRSMSSDGVRDPRLPAISASRTGSCDAPWRGHTLTLDGTAVAGQEASGLDRSAQNRLELGQRLADAVLDRTGLARQTAALDGADHVILTFALGDAEHLVDDETQRRTCEIDFLVTTVDRDLARTRLQPDASDGVLTTAGRIGAAELVQFLLTQRGRADALGGSGRRFTGSGGLRRSGSGLLVQGGAEIGERLAVIGHYAPTLFLRFIDAMSRTSGF